MGRRRHCDAAATGMETTDSAGSLSRDAVQHFLESRPPGFLDARSSATLQLPILERRPSEALDSWQLSYYLEYRRVPISSICELGEREYFQQYPNQDIRARQEIAAQLASESDNLGMAGTIELFRFFLDAEHGERFFEGIFLLLARRVRADQCSFSLADLLQRSPEQPDARTPSAASEATEDSEDTVDYQHTYTATSGEIAESDPYM